MRTALEIIGRIPSREGIENGKLRMENGEEAVRRLLRDTLVVYLGWPAWYEAAGTEFRIDNG